MKGSADLLKDSVRSVYLKPADLCVKSALLSIRKAMLRLDMAKALHRKAYKEQLKGSSIYEAKRIVGPYDTIFDLIKETGPKELRKKLNAVVAEGFRRDITTLPSQSPFKHARIHIPERLLDILREEVQDECDS